MDELPLRDSVFAHSCAEVASLSDQTSGGDLHRRPHALWAASISRMSVASAAAEAAAIDIAQSNSPRIGRLWRWRRAYRQPE